MRCLLDTCTLSHFARRHPLVVQRFEVRGPADLAVSAISVHEVEYGLRSNAVVEKRIGRVMRSLLGVLQCLAFDQNCAHRAADLRAALRTAGTPISAYDLLIAATAMEHGLVLVTSNIRELAQVPGLELEDWSS